MGIMFASIISDMGYMILILLANMFFLDFIVYIEDIDRSILRQILQLAQFGDDQQSS